MPRVGLPKIAALMMPLTGSMDLNPVRDNGRIPRHFARLYACRVEDAILQFKLSLVIPASLGLFLRERLLRLYDRESTQLHKSS